MGDVGMKMTLVFLFFLISCLLAQEDRIEQFWGEYERFVDLQAERKEWIEKNQDILAQAMILGYEKQERLSLLIQDYKIFFPQAKQWLVDQLVFFSFSFYDEKKEEIAWECLRRTFLISIEISGVEDTITLVTRLGKFFQGRRHTNKARALFEYAVSLAEEKNDGYLIGLAYYSLGLLEKEASHLILAETYFSKSLKMARDTMKDDTLFIFHCISCLGATLLKMGKTEEAQLHLEEALKLQQKYFPDGLEEIELFFHDLGFLYQNIGEYHKSAEYYQKALSILEKQEGKESMSVAMVKRHLGTLFIKQKKLADALKWIEEALNIQREKDAVDSPEMAETLQVLGTVYSGLEETAKARESFLKAWEIFQKHGAEDTVLIARLKSDMADVLQQEEKMEEAQKMYEEVLCVYKEKLGKDHVSVWEVVHRLSMVDMALGNYTRGLGRAKEALGGFQRIYGAEHESIAGVCNLISLLYQNLGDWENAYTYSLRAVALCEKLLGRKHPDTATSMNSHAILLLRMGNADNAVNFLKEAQEIFGIYGYQNTSLMATILHNIGRLLEKSGKEELALEYFRKSLDIEGKKEPKRWMEIATCLNSIACLLRYKQPEEAKKNLYQARNILEKNSIQKHPVSGQIFYNLAILLKDSQEYEEAYKIYEKALEIFSMFSHKNFYLKACCLKDMADICQKKGNREKALLLFQEALENMEKTLLYVKNLPETEQQTYIYLYITPFLNVGISLLQDSPQDYEKIYNMILAYHGYTLRTLWMRNKSKNNPLALDVWTRYQNKARQYAMQYFEEQNSQKTERLDEEMRKCESEWIEKTKESTFVMPLNFKELQKKLLPKEALVHFFSYYNTNQKEDRIVVFVIFRDKPLVCLEIGSEEKIQKACSELYNLFESMGEIKRRHYFSSNAARNLYEMVWKKISLYVEGNKRIYLVPDSFIGMIPWEALPDFSSKKERYCVEKYQFCYLNSAYELLFEEKIASGKGFLGVGAVDYGTCSPEKNLYGELTYTGREIQEIESIYKKAYPGEKHIRLMEKDASKKNLILSLPGKKYIHIASHGFFWEKNKPESSILRYKNRLLVSGIALKDANLSLESGILTAYDLSLLNLQGIELMVLSCCTTGTGLWIKGHGIAGLRTASLCAGVRSLMVSLWDVQDQETQKFMQKFYQNLWMEKTGKLDSLHKTKLEWIQKEKEEKIWKGNVWASFILLGKP